MTTDGASRRPRFLSGIRWRLIVPFVALLALATAGSVFVVRAILIQRLDDRVNDEMVQEARELQRLADGIDPKTGESFDGDVERIFTVFLERNIPTRYEAMITFVDGGPYKRSRQVVSYRLDTDPELVERWRNVQDTRRGRVDTPEGPVDYMAVPLRDEGETRGVFVVAVFLELAREGIAPAVAGAAGVGVIALLLGSLLAWRIADRILGPVARVTETARGITESDFRRRIEVSDEDEIARLAQTFNEMLDRLEEAFNTQRRFIDDAGHELRTPITIIQGQLDVLGDDPEDRRRALEIVQDELGRMSRFVDDLLLLARAERPDFLSLDAIDVALLTEELLSKASALADRNWSVDSVANGRIVADRQRVTQAMMQLSQNATQHTGTGDPIAIGSRFEGKNVRLWVRDGGPGIPVGERKAIFDRFRRGSSGRLISEGAGLGLSIVQAIAHAHRGRIDLDTEVGKGTTFTLVLPIDPPLADEEVS